MSDSPQVEEEEKTSRTQTKRIRQQTLFAGYAMSISLFSPMMNLYQLHKLHPHLQPRSYLRLTLSIYPQQFLLRMAQVNIATPVKENLEPWLAFGTLGFMQGIVYGHANVSFAKQFGLVKSMKVATLLRGSPLAVARDTISQGFPFMLSHRLSQTLLEPLLPGEEWLVVKHWSSVLGLSVVSTYLSHGFHVWQTELQACPSLGYGEAVKRLYNQHGPQVWFRGAEGRVGLLLLTNIFNEIFLKPAWADRD